MHWCQLWWQFLPRCGTDPNSETKLIAWESTDLYFQEPDIPVVADTRWLGSMAGRWLGGPMAVVGPVVEKADKGCSSHELALLAFNRCAIYWQSQRFLHCIDLCQILPLFLSSLQSKIIGSGGMKLSRAKDQWGSCQPWELYTMATYHSV